MHKLMHHPMVRKCCNKDLGRLIIRLGVGLIFIYHGWGKVEHMQNAIGFFNTLGLAAFFAYLVAFVELVGGVALVLGVFTGLAGSLLAIDMLFAIIFFKWAMVKQMGFGAMEFEFVLLVASLGLGMLGAGKYALMAGHGCCGNCNASTCMNGACCMGCKASSMTCDNCDGCKGGCTMHEDKKATCDNCDTCTSGCTMHEMKK